jgi:phage-related protein
MATLATLAVKLIGDTSGFAKDMDGASGHTKRFADDFEGQAKRIGGLGSIMSGAMSWVTGNVIMKGIDAVVGSLGSLKAGMIDGNAEFERYQVQFGVLLGSTDAAKQRLDELAKFGASTPFDLPGVVQADKIIQGFGLHSEESAKKFGFTGEQIRTIAGDVAAGTGTSFQDMANYIGKFSSGATGEVISRFQELGITTREELTKLGLEFSKSGELLSPLPQATQVVLDLMKSKYGGMMQAQSGTFEGMMSNMNDWIAGTLRTLGQPIFEVLKDKLGGVLTFLASPEVVGAINGFATTLAGGIGSAIAFITPIIDQGIGLFTTFADQIDYFVRMVVDGFDTAGPFGAVSNAIYFIADALGLGGDEASAFSDNVGTAVSNVIGFVQSVVAFVQANLPAFQAAFTSAIGSVIALVQSNWPTIQTIIETVITGISTIFETVLKPALEFAFQLFSKISAWVIENWPLISQTVSTVLNAILSVVQTVIPIISTVFTTVFNALKPIVEGALNLVLGIVKSIMQLINGDTAGALLTLQTAFTDAFGAVVKFVESLPEKFISFGRQVIQGFIDGMNQMGEALKAKIYALIPEPVRKILGIASPSKLMDYFGRMSAIGFVTGWEDVFDRHPLKYALSTPTPAMPAGGTAPTHHFDYNELTRPGQGGLTGAAAANPGAGGLGGGAAASVTLTLDGTELGRVLLPHINSAAQTDVERYSSGIHHQ